MLFITALLIILSILIICSIFSIDHFKPINSLNIKYNTNNIKIPNQLEKPSKKELSIKEKIISELNSSPLGWQNQMYSMPVYPYVGSKTPCTNDSDCSLTAECNHYRDIFNRNLGIGVCTVRNNNKTVFDIDY